jgi:hypothetical protein
LTPREPVLDRMPSDAEINELRPANHAVLPSRQLTDLSTDHP